MDYRDDDERNIGACPKCGRRLSNLTKEAKGFCDIHGWVFAEWQWPTDEIADQEEREHRAYLREEEE